MGKKKLKLPPVIFQRGGRVSLRPLNESDLPWLLRWTNDPEVSEFSIRHRPVTAVVEKRQLEKSLADESNDVRLGVVLNRRQRLIGTVNLRQVSLVHGTAWAGIVIGCKECWGNGYGF